MSALGRENVDGGYVYGSDSEFISTSDEDDGYATPSGADSDNDLSRFTNYFDTNTDDNVDEWEDEEIDLAPATEVALTSSFHDYWCQSNDLVFDYMYYCEPIVLLLLSMYLGLCVGYFLSPGRDVRASAPVPTVFSSITSTASHPVTTGVLITATTTTTGTIASVIFTATTTTVTVTMTESDQGTVSATPSETYDAPAATIAPSPEVPYSPESNCMFLRRWRRNIRYETRTMQLAQPKWPVSKFVDRVILSMDRFIRDVERCLDKGRYPRTAGEDDQNKLRQESPRQKDRRHPESSQAPLEEKKNEQRSTRDELEKIEEESMQIETALERLREEQARLKKEYQEEQRKAIGNYWVEWVRRMMNEVEGLVR
ncbi:uncharacterized protein N0V89_012279 [Didymosphaeria variabile]|uniref:Uncharacterized protein n=1 Tax=Didymosphaeria variabile TaxID=1932322 RepID=A0A9W9C591_9PLEO|nr:uncharacterized protein N0V89_012279 [Didymosphaeria variabile]KAJ4344536.1 hypothetical protein N0V89_012279 [Didymosphaeria variabile]